MAKPRKRTTTRAETLERVNTIVDLMAELRWNRKEANRLGEEWGVGQSRVEGLAAEASRVVRGHLADPEDIRAKIIAALTSIAAEARHAKTVVVHSDGTKRMISKPDYQSAIRALDVSAELLGLKKQRLEVELESDLERKMGELGRALSPETFQLVAAVLAGKGGDALPGGGDEGGTGR